MNDFSGVSVIIPFRNEACTLPAIIAALERQIMVSKNIEVIWVDDASDDEGHFWVKDAVSRNVGWRYLQSEGAPGKKCALHTGIMASKYDNILTTDADCTMGPEWIYRAIELMQSHHDLELFILPVVVRSEGNLRSQWQFVESLQLLALSRITSALRIPVLCSGANLIFRKTFYERSFSSRDDWNIASGDDMFLLEQSYCARFFATEAITVMTHPVSDFNSLIHQRVRWFGKVSKLKRFHFFAVGVVVGIWQFGLYILAGLTMIYPMTLKAFMIFGATKIFTDLTLQFFMARRLNLRFHLMYSLLFIILYPLFQVIIILASLYIKPVWKGREIVV